FFFQAEDGIRDFHVTGVQTCALPIFIYLFYAYCFFVAVSATIQQIQFGLGMGKRRLTYQGSRISTVSSLILNTGFRWSARIVMGQSLIIRRMRWKLFNVWPPKCQLSSNVILLLHRTLHWF